MEDPGFASLCTKAIHTVLPEHTGFIYLTPFWIVGILLVINSLWVKEQYERFATAEKLASLDSIPWLSKHRDFRFFWLQPHITTRPRKILAIVACSAVVPLQIIEFTCVFRVTFRLTDLALRDYVVGSLVKEYHNVAVRCALMALVMVACGLGWFLLTLVTVSSIFVQVSYILQLASIRPAAPLGLEGGLQARRTLSRFNAKMGEKNPDIWIFNR